MPEARTLPTRGAITRDSAPRTIASPLPPDSPIPARPFPNRGGISPERGGSSTGRPIAIPGAPGIGDGGGATPDPNTPFYGSGNPFEILADAFLRGFGSGNYYPPLQSQAYGYTPTGGTNWTLILILGALGVGAYLYFRS